MKTATEVIFRIGLLAAAWALVYVYWESRRDENGRYAYVHVENGNAGIVDTRKGVVYALMMCTGRDGAQTSIVRTDLVGNAVSLMTPNVQMLAPKTTLR